MGAGEQQRNVNCAEDVCKGSLVYVEEKRLSRAENTQARLYCRNLGDDDRREQFENENQKTMNRNAATYSRDSSSESS